MAQGNGAQPAQLPLYYQRPAPLSPERHGDQALVKAVDFGFTAVSNAVPLVLQEMTLAAKSYPIVFTSGKPAAPVAVLGVKNQQNLFVEADGRWQNGHYVPAYVRRYPFIFTNHPENDQLVLCIDEACPRLEKVGNATSEALFEAGEASPVLKTALQFCEEFQRHLAVTQAFMAAVEEKDLLVEKEMTFRTTAGTTYRLSGFRMIDEARFNALEDTVILDWRKRGWLGFVYCHLISTSNLMLIGDRAAQKDMAQA